jgi:hypothetical protein
MLKMTLVVSAILTSCTFASAQVLVAIDSGRAISRIDPITGAKTVFKNATANAGTTAGLAVDLATNVLYLASSSTDSLYTLDVNTGNATLVGPFGDATIVMHGLEIDASTGTLYGASGGGSNFNLYTISKVTGAATLVGPLGLSSFTNLCYDLTSNTMYATNSNTDSWYMVNLATGAATLIGPLSGPTNPNGLAYDLASNTIYLVDNNTDSLYTVNRATGSATLVGPTGAGNLLGLVSMPHTGTYSVFGSGCAGTLGVPVNLGVVPPAAGETMVANFGNLPFDIAVVMLGFSNTTATGFGPLPIDLGVLGAPGCSGRVSPDQSFFVVGTAGTAAFVLPIPNDPAVFVGVDFYTQALVFDSVNAFGFTLSDAAGARIGI